jgi:DNA topoisomerase VI subunit B
LEDAGRKFRRFITHRETVRRKAKRAGILAMYADQFAQSLSTIVNEKKGKELFDPEVIAGKIRDSILGFELPDDEVETETDSPGSDLVADMPLTDEDTDSSSEV